MKRGLLLTLILGIFLISFVSAQFLGRFYRGYFDSSLILYGGLFVLFFATINFLLGRTIFRENQGTRIIIGLVISLFAVYGIATSNFSAEIGNIYLGNWYLWDSLSVILPFIIIAGIVISILKFGLGKVLMILSLLLIIVSFTNLVYEKNIILIFGIILFLIGLKFWSVKRKKEKLKEMGYWERQEYEEKEKRALKRWGGAGRKIGYGLAKTAYGAKKIYEKQQRKSQIRERARNMKRIKEERLRREKKVYRPGDVVDLGK